MPKLIRNSIRTPDGTEIVSTHRHDFVCHTDANGKRYCVDGGLDYARRLFDGPYTDVTDTSLYDDEPHVVQRDVLLWGTYGINGDQPLKYVKISEMETAHIEAVLEIKGISKVHEACMQNELIYRKVYQKSS
jgi:hypothetical protein